MARSARKPERETDESAKQASTKPDKTITTPPAGEAADDCRGSRERNLIEARHGVRWLPDRPV